MFQYRFRYRELNLFKHLENVIFKQQKIEKPGYIYATDPSQEQQLSNWSQMQLTQSKKLDHITPVTIPLV